MTTTSKNTTNVVSENAIPTFEEICVKAQKDKINPYGLLKKLLLDSTPTFSEDSDNKKFQSLTEKISDFQQKISELEKELKPLASVGYLQTFENLCHEICTYYPKNSGDNVQLTKVENILKYYTTFNKIGEISSVQELVKIAENTLIRYDKRSAHINARAKVADLFTFFVEDFGAPRNLTTYRKAYNKYLTMSAK